MRTIFSLTILLCFFNLHSQETYTDGLNYYDYVDDELFLVFKKKFWEKRKEDARFSYKKALEDNILFVRLEGHVEQLASLRKIGKHNRADKLAQRDKERNKDLIEGIRDFHPGGTYYFYYPQHAREIFVDNNFKNLLSSDLTPAENVQIDEFALALFNNHLYLWDVEGLSMGRISRNKTHPIFQRRFNVFTYEGLRRFFGKLR